MFKKAILETLAFVFQISSAGLVIYSGHFFDAGDKQSAIYYLLLAILVFMYGTFDRKKEETI